MMSAELTALIMGIFTDNTEFSKRLDNFKGKHKLLSFSYVHINSLYTISFAR